jgi:hypothetical protein
MKKPSPYKTEKVRILAVFGDFKGFSDFYEASAFDEEDREQFMDAYDSLIEQIERETGFIFDDTGDGFFCPIDLKGGHACHTTLKAFKALWKLYRKIVRLIDNKNHPRPDGFCMTAFSGAVTRKIKKNGKIVYRGPHINWAHKCLHLHKGIGFIVHASARQHLSRKQEFRNKLIYKPLPLLPILPDGLPKKEASVLYSLKMDERNHDL